MDKKYFFATKFGQELESVIRRWDKALTERKRARQRIGDGAEYLEKYEYQDRLCQQCLDKWEVFQLAIKHFFGIECNFAQTDKYFGVVTDTGDWLIRIEKDMERRSV